MNKTTITIEKDLHVLIKVAAARKRMTIAEYVRYMYGKVQK